ncbi:MAG TPA: glutathione S-transferase [Psychromonas sp.]
MPNTLYSFRRCPYAIRARLAIAVSSQPVFLREIMLKNKPPEMLALSSKGTVPVLQLADGTVLDESLDIMVWALEQRDPNAWLQGSLTEMLNLIDENDFEFKDWLDKYKYADRFPQYPALYYREQAEEFLLQLENRLSNSPYLFGQQISLADMAILPFIRQFSGVDKDWFVQSPYPFLKVWLDNFINSTLFNSVMKKYPIWLESGQQSTFPETQSSASFIV